MRKNTTEGIERQEIIQKLIDNGYDKLVEVFLMNESSVYTKKARLNKSGACRILECTPKELDNTLAECKKLLKNDVYHH